MRGIVTLATALALPAAFPHRNFIQLTAFVVVLGTLLIQGLTLRPLLSVMRLPADDIVERETSESRRAALKAALEEIADDGTEAAQRLRGEYRDALSRTRTDGDPRAHSDNALRLRMVDSGRRAIDGLRRTGAIGDDAYRTVEEELDRLEVAASPMQGDRA